jgi:arylsulfatase
MAMPCLAAMFCAETRAQAVAPQRLNSAFVLIAGAAFSDFGAYGSETATPHIDSLAIEGQRFTNFHTACNGEATRVMLQSRVDLHPASAGTLSVVIAGNQNGASGYKGYLSDHVRSVGRLMRDGGYASQYSGK